jgi:hypothetical protein
MDPELVSRLGEAALADTEVWAADAAQTATLAFDGELRRLCGEHDISVQGRFPTYVLDGYLRVRVSQSDGVCTIGSKKIKSLFVKRAWMDIASLVKEERARQNTQSDLLAFVYSAYLRSVAARNDKPGTSVPIRDLFREMAIMRQHGPAPSSGQMSAKYTEELFKRDLSRLMAKGEFMTRDGCRMHLLPTAFPKEGVSVNIGEGVRIIGHIAFGDVS